jgi:Xaa-Pro aminopeptidase
MPYKNRLSKLQNQLKIDSIPALIIDNPIDLFYLTGIELSLGRLVLTADDAELLIDGRYFEACNKTSPVRCLLSNNQDFSHLALKRVAFDSKFTSYHTYKSVAKKLNGTTLIPLEAPLQKIRSIKDSLEETALSEAADLGSRGYQYVISLLKEGISEIEVATELEIFWKREGASKPAFDINVSFGANSSMPHHRAGTTRLKRGDPVLMDIGVTLNYYNSDMTRVLFFGEPSSEMKEVYLTVKDAQQAALALCKPGAVVGDLDRAARDLITERGYGKNFTHSLGHGIGLEVHEYPILRSSAPFKDAVLQPGMAITIEPGVYLSDIGGVRIEDTIFITESGHRNLTNLPKELHIL